MQVCGIYITIDNTKIHVDKDTKSGMIGTSKTKGAERNEK